MEYKWNKCIMSHLTLTEASQGEQQARHPPPPPPPKKRWQQSSAQKAVTIDRKGGKNCDSNNPFFKHWKRHLFTFAFGCFYSEITKSLPWGGASLFSWSGDWPLLVSMNCDVMKNCFCECVIGVHSMKCELPKSSILFTFYTEDEYWRY